MGNEGLAVGCFAKVRLLDQEPGTCFVEWEAMTGWDVTSRGCLSSACLLPAGEEKRIREFYQSRGLDRVTQPSSEGGQRGGSWLDWGGGVSLRAGQGGASRAEAGLTPAPSPYLPRHGRG